MYYFRSEFEEGNQVIVHSIKKAKRLPGTKEANKYIGPYSVEKVTPSHLLARKYPNSKATKLPIHLSRKYYSRKQPVSKLWLIVYSLTNYSFLFKFLVTPTKNPTADITPTGFSISHAIGNYIRLFTAVFTNALLASMVRIFLHTISTFNRKNFNTLSLNSFRTI